jgi:hypothetical protein
MKKVLFIAMLFVSFFSQAQTWNNVNGRWGYQWLRAPLALFIPSGNGAPSGTASLNNAGYKGQAALYSDTTNKKLYLFNPADSTWTDVTAGGGGGGTVTSVSGTPNRISVTNPTTTPVIDLSINYIGQPSITTLGTIGTGVWNGTGIGPTFGGTGQTTVTTGDLLYGSASNTWAKLPGVATGNALISGGVGTAFAWGKIGLTTHVSGILPVANGGTGTATPGLIQGANVTITGSWPNQTINASGGGGSSATAGIQTTVTGTAVNYDPHINSNLILNDFLLPTIGSKWDASNATNTTITFSAGHMRLVGGNAADYIYDSITTIVHRWTEEIRAVIQSVGGSDYFSFGIQSQGVQTILFKIKNSDLSGTVTYNNGATTLGTTAAQGTTSVGDSVTYRIRRDNYTLYFDVVNVTQSTSQTLTYNYTDVDGAGAVIPFRAFSVTLNPVAGTIDIDYAKLYNQERLYADWLVIGHSIAEGFNAGPPDSTYYNRLQTYFTDKRFGLYAVSGSKAIDFVGANSQKEDMLALRPKRALIMLGVNEIQAGTTTAAFIANMRALVDTLENHSTQVVVCNTTPYNAANKAAIIAYNAALLTEFGRQVINIYDTLEINGLMQNSTDSLHPDAPGHRYLFNVLKDEITRLTNIPYDPEGIIRIFPRGIESGISAPGIQSNFGLIPLNLGNSGTFAPGVGYNVKFQTTNDYKYKGSDYANFIQMGTSGGKMVFKVAASGTAGDAISFTDAMTITPGGDAGIGEVTPLAALHIKRNQSGKTTAGEASMLILDNTSGATGQRQEIGMGYRNGNAYSPIVIGNVVTDNTDFTKGDLYILTRDAITNTAPSERLRVKANGNLLINTTTDNGYSLQVNGAISTVTDSAGSPKNMAWIDTNGKIRKAAVPSGGGSDLTGAAIKMNIHIVSDADYTVGSTDYAIVYTSITATRTLTIPAASSAANRVISISNPGAGSFSVNLSQTIRYHGSSTSTIVGVGNRVTIVSDGSEWWVIHAE